MIRILYFGRLREQVQTGEENLDYSDTLVNVGQLVGHLGERGESWQSALNGQAAILVAVNQEMADPQTPLSDGDEVAFFPPITGG